MANNTVYPYGPGGQLPSGIAIVNDFTTGGADKALSAEMGKVLHTIVDNEGTPTVETAIAISSLQSCGGVINVSTGKWATLSNYDSSLIPKSTYEGYTHIRITPASGNATGIAFTVNGFSSGATVQYASGTTYTSLTAGSEPQVFEIPSDANYIYIPLAANGNRKPAALTLISYGQEEGLVQKVAELYQMIPHGLQSAVVAEEGLFFVDANLNIGAKVVQEGFISINSLTYREE